MKFQRKIKQLCRRSWSVELGSGSFLQAGDVDGLNLAEVEISYIEDSRICRILNVELDFVFADDDLQLGIKGMVVAGHAIWHEDIRIDVSPVVFEVVEKRIKIEDIGVDLAVIYCLGDFFEAGGIEIKLG